MLFIEDMNQIFVEAALYHSRDSKEYTCMVWISENYE